MCFLVTSHFIVSHCGLKRVLISCQKRKSFNDATSVIDLGVGKNMVTSIRFWMRAFRLTENDVLSPIADFLFDTQRGADPFCEDLVTLWILHFHLVHSSVASIYQLSFVDFQRERKEFDKLQLQTFIKRRCNVPEQKNVYNENTVKKDIAVLLQNYVTPSNLKQIEHFTSLLISLNLISDLGDGRFRFNEKNTEDVPEQVIVYALLCMRGADKTLSFDVIQYLSLVFCMPITAFLQALVDIEKHSSGSIVYTDNSGIRNVHFMREIDSFKVLSSYYQVQ